MPSPPSPPPPPPSSASAQAATTSKRTPADSLRVQSASARARERRRESARASSALKTKKGALVVYIRETLATRPHMRTRYKPHNQASSRKYCIASVRIGQKNNCKKPNKSLKPSQLVEAQASRCLQFWSLQTKRSTYRHLQPQHTVKHYRCKKANILTKWYFVLNAACCFVCDLEIGMMNAGRFKLFSASF